MSVGIFSVDRGCQGGDRRDKHVLHLPIQSGVVDGQRRLRREVFQHRDLRPEGGGGFLAQQHEHPHQRGFALQWKHAGCPVRAACPVQGNGDRLPRRGGLSHVGAQRRQFCLFLHRSVQPPCALESGTASILDQID